jgi:hypothetical protein
MNVGGERIAEDQHTQVRFFEVTVDPVVRKTP